MINAQNKKLSIIIGLFFLFSTTKTLAFQEAVSGLSSTGLFIDVLQTIQNQTSLLLTKNTSTFVARDNYHLESVNDFGCYGQEMNVAVTNEGVDGSHYRSSLEMNCGLHVIELSLSYQSPEAKALSMNDWLNIKDTFLKMNELEELEFSAPNIGLRYSESKVSHEESEYELELEKSGSFYIFLTEKRVVRASNLSQWFFLRTHNEFPIFEEVNFSFQSIELSSGVFDYHWFLKDKETSSSEFYEKIVQPIRSALIAANDFQ